MDDALTQLGDINLSVVEQLNTDIGATYQASQKLVIGLLAVALVGGALIGFFLSRDLAVRIRAVGPRRDRAGRRRLDVDSVQAQSACRPPGRHECP